MKPVYLRWHRIHNIKPATHSIVVTTPHEHQSLPDEPERLSRVQGVPPGEEGIARADADIIFLANGPTVGDGDIGLPI